MPLFAFVMQGLCWIWTAGICGDRRGLVRGRNQHSTCISHLGHRGSVDPHFYRQRNLIERFFNKLKHFRRIATRFDKLARNFLAAVLLASTRLWTRAYESTT